MSARHKNRIIMTQATVVKQQKTVKFTRWIYLHTLTFYFIKTKKELNYLYSNKLHRMEKSKSY